MKRILLIALLAFAACGAPTPAPQTRVTVSPEREALFWRRAMVEAHRIDAMTETQVLAELETGRAAPRRQATPVRRVAAPNG